MEKIFSEKIWLTKVFLILLIENICYIMLAMFSSISKTYKENNWKLSFKIMLNKTGNVSAYTTSLTLLIK